MINSKAFDIQVQIIINQNLYNKKIIDEDSYMLVNDKLLNSLKLL